MTLFTTMVPKCEHTISHPKMKSPKIEMGTCKPRRISIITSPSILCTLYRSLLMVGKLTSYNMKWSRGSLTTNKTTKMEIIKEMVMMDEIDIMPYCFAYGVMDEM